MDISNKTPQRIRHEVRTRLLDVVQVTDITPAMRRITLAGPDLAGFTSLGFDDHIKVFFFPPGTKPVKPETGPEGIAFPEGMERPPMRDYTPRRYDAAAGTLEIDFVLHGDGPASGWAAQAAVGQKLLLGGPRGSMVVPLAFDWYLLMGDETALPAIGRRLEELPAGCKAVVVVEVASAQEEQRLATQADAEIVFVHRNGPARGEARFLLDALAARDLPAGEAFAFIGAEGTVSKAVRAALEARGWNPAWIKAAGYWLYGQADAHEPH